MLYSHGAMGAVLGTNKPESITLYCSNNRNCHVIPFTPESDQCQISPAASPEILHHTV